MAETFQDFDVEEFRLPPSLYGEIQTRQLPPRPGEGEPFIRGPIRFSWVALASQLPGSCLIVAMAARFLRSRYPRKSSWSVAEIGWRAGLEERSARQSLQALSEAGLISLSRKPGCKPALAILELEGPETHEPAPLGSDSLAMVAGRLPASRKGSSCRFGVLAPGGLGAIRTIRAGSRMARVGSLATLDVSGPGVAIGGRLGGSYPLKGSLAARHDSEGRDNVSGGGAANDWPLRVESCRAIRAQAAMPKKPKGVRGCRT